MRQSTLQFTQIFTKTFNFLWFHRLLFNYPLSRRSPPRLALFPLRSFTNHDGDSLDKWTYNSSESGYGSGFGKHGEQRYEQYLTYERIKITSLNNRRSHFTITPGIIPANAQQ